MTVRYRDPNVSAKTFELIPERPLEIGPQSSPLQVSLGPDGLQRLFTKSGVLSAAGVNEFLL